MGVVGVLHLTDPGGESVGNKNEINKISSPQRSTIYQFLLGASSSRAIRESPSRLSVNSVVACALVVGSASTVTVASVGAVRRNSDNY